MATMTKPRPRAGKMSTIAGDPMTRARRHIAVTKRKVSQMMNTEANRSTKAQRAQRMKAEAFERLDDILAGRE